MRLHRWIFSLGLASLSAAAEPQSIEIPNAWVQTLAFSGTNERLWVGLSNKTLLSIDVASREIQSTQTDLPSEITALATSSATERWVAGTWDGTLEIRKVDSEAVDRSWPGHEEMITSLAISADGAFLASGSADDWVRLWDMETGDLILEFYQGDEYDVTGVALSPDANTLAMADGDNLLTLWDTQTGAQRRVLRGHNAALSGVDWLTHENRIVSTSWDKTVRVWNPESGDCLQTLDASDGELNALAVQPNQPIWVTGGDDQTTRRGDLRESPTMTVIATHGSQVTAVALSPNGRHAASGGHGELFLIQLDPP